MSEKICQVNGCDETADMISPAEICYFCWAEWFFAAEKDPDKALAILLSGENLPLAEGAKQFIEESYLEWCAETGKDPEPALASWREDNGSQEG